MNLQRVSLILRLQIGFKSKNLCQTLSCQNLFDPPLCLHQSLIQQQNFIGKTGGQR